MKFSAVRVTSDDEYPNFLIAIETPVDSTKVEFFKFWCNESDLKMMRIALDMEIKPHPQYIIKGCPCLGFKTCKDCAENYQNIIKEIKGRVEEMQR
jgi:hypothetical protein